MKDGKTLNTRLEIIRGLKMEFGYISPSFINTTKGGNKVLLHDALVLLCVKKISHMQDLMPALELAQGKQLLIIAEDVDSEALSTLVLNRVKKGMQVCAVKTSEFTTSNQFHILKDIATATGATLFGSEEFSEANLETIKLSDFGKVGEAQITKDSTLLLNCKGDKTKLEKRLKQLSNEIESISLSTPSSEFVSSAELERERLKARFAKLTNGVAIIHVGGISEVHVNEQIDIIIDALNATKCAIEEGIFIELMIFAL